MRLTDLQEIKASGWFHHATYRNVGKIWEGLYVYIKSEGGFRGFDLAGCFPKGHPELEAATDLCHGYSVGSYGKG